MNEQLNSDFKHVCKTLFGEEIGELEDFEGYLLETMFPYRLSKSFVSGKEVFLSNAYYPDGAKFVSQDEVKGLEFKPLSVNEIKDVDSLFEAVRERVVYCGNKVFGTNLDVERVDNSVDCSTMYFCHNMLNSKYAAYSCYSRQAEHHYGVGAFPESSYMLRCFDGIGGARSFETYLATNVSDAYYAFNCRNCSNCFFGFNLNSKSHVIGNLQLSKDRYLQLKQKLVSEIAEKLRKDKRVFSFVDVAKQGAKDSGASVVHVPPSKIPEAVENAFKTTMKLVLGLDCGNSERFADWLLEKAIKVERVKGAFGNPAYAHDIPLVKDIPAQKLASLKEALAASSDCIAIGEKESPSLEELARRVSEKAVFPIEFVDGRSENVVDTPVIFDSTNIYRLWDATHGTLSGYGTSAGFSKYVFGSRQRILRAEFCINCCDVTDVKGCFETDSSYRCRGAFFCHNCENVEEGMFCFNAKGLRYAVGNTEVGREEFMRVKKLLLDYVKKELEEKGRLDVNIFNLGTFRRRAA